MRRRLNWSAGLYASVSEVFLDVRRCESAPTSHDSESDLSGLDRASERDHGNSEDFGGSRLVQKSPELFEAIHWFGVSFRAAGARLPLWATQLCCDQAAT